MGCNARGRDPWRAPVPACARTSASMVTASGARLSLQRQSDRRATASGAIGESFMSAWKRLSWLAAPLTSPSCCWCGGRARRRRWQRLRASGASGRSSPVPGGRTGWTAALRRLGDDRGEWQCVWASFNRASGAREWFWLEARNSPRSLLAVSPCSMSARRPSASSAFSGRVRMRQSARR